MDKKLEAGSVGERETATIMTCCFLLFDWYLNCRVLRSEEPMLAWLRRNVLWFRCRGGTQFSGAVLMYTDFTTARNLRLAWTYGSPLEPRSLVLSMTLA